MPGYVIGAAKAILARVMINAVRQRLRAGSATEPPPEPNEGDGERSVRSSRRFDLMVAVGYGVLAGYVAVRLFVDPAVRSPSAAGGDHALFQWMFAHGARVVFDGESPFFSSRLNAPDGVNLMANTSALGLTIPMAPVTALWGPYVSYAIVLVIGLAGTAFGWYWLFSRRLVSSRFAAILGGAFCAFAPGMVTHTQGHLNWTTQLLVPFIVDRLFRLREPGKTMRNGAILAALMIYQIFIAEEVLFYVGLGTGVFGVLYAALRWNEVRPQLRTFFGGLGVATVLVLAVVAHPLWWQFFGPQSYHGIPEGGTQLGNDLRSFVTFPRQSLAGDESLAARVGVNATEENSFFGWPLLIVLACVAGWLRHEVLVRAAVGTSVLFGLLSLGPAVTWNGISIGGIPGPWRLLDELPLFDAVVPTRLAMIAIPCIGLILALAADRILGLERGEHTAAIRWLGLAAAAAALLPLFPRPLPVGEHRLPPPFIANGMWQEYLQGDRTLVIATGDHPLDATGMRWSARVGLDLAVTDGYFLGPGGPGGRAHYGALDRPTRLLLLEVGRTGVAPTLTAANRTDLLEDLRYWRAGAVTVPDHDPAAVALRATLTALIGDPGRSLGGVHVWDVRHLTS